MTQTIRTARQILSVPDGVTLRDKWKRHLVRTGLRLVEDDRVLPAYVNLGRWVADCPECNGGIAVETVTVQGPNVGEGCCLDCGHRYTIAVPNGYEAAEKVLGQRPAANRNWRPDRGETTDELEYENRIKGLGAKGER